MTLQKHIRRTVGALIAVLVMLVILTIPVVTYAVSDEYETYYEIPPRADGSSWSNVETAELDITGNLYNFKLVCIKGDTMLAVISTEPGVDFFATSVNLTDWVIQSSSAGWYFYHEERYYWCDGSRMIRTSDWRNNWEVCNNCKIAADLCQDNISDQYFANFDQCAAKIQDYFNYIRPLAYVELSQIGIKRIERIPYMINDGIMWIGYVVREDVEGNIHRRQLRIFADGVQKNILPSGTLPAWVGLDTINWAQDAAAFIADRGLMTMYACTYTNEYVYFNPMGMATRGDVLAASIMTLELQSPNIYELENYMFDDVPLYGRGIHINIARQLGIVAGIGNNEFSPEGIITRQDMMTMLYNILLALGQIEPDIELTALGRFRDVNQIASYARLPISSLAKVGIIAGDGININPRGYMTRVEAAMFVWNLYRINNS